MDVSAFSDSSTGIIFSGRLQSADLFRRAIEVFSKCGCTILYMEVFSTGLFLTNYNIVDGDDGATVATNRRKGKIMLTVMMRKADDITDFVFRCPQWATGGRVCVGITVSYALEILRNCTKSDSLNVSLNLDDDRCDSADAGLKLYFTIPGPRMMEENCLSVSKVGRIEDRMPLPLCAPVSLKSDDFKKIHKKMNKSAQNRFTISRRGTTLLMHKNTESVYYTKLTFRDCSQPSCRPSEDRSTRDPGNRSIMCSAHIFASLEKIVSQGSSVAFYLENTTEDPLRYSNEELPDSESEDDDGDPLRDLDDDNEQDVGDGMIPLILSSTIRGLGILKISIPGIA